LFFCVFFYGNIINPANCCSYQSVFVKGFGYWLLFSTFLFETTSTITAKNSLHQQAAWGQTQLYTLLLRPNLSKAFLFTPFQNLFQYANKNHHDQLIRAKGCWDNFPSSLPKPSTNTKFRLKGQYHLFNPLQILTCHLPFIDIFLFSIYYKITN